MFQKRFLYFLVVAFIFGGCTKKTDEIFDKSPDQRLAEALAAYQKALVGAPNGWKLVVRPKGLEAQDIKVGAFSYYMKFTDANRVTMLSDFDTATASTPKESSYRLKAVQRPSIYFDSYSYLHLPSDPTATVSRSPSGNDGDGWGSDFDFAFVELPSSADTFRLKGNFNKSEAMLIKATPQEAANYNNKQLAASLRLLQNLNFIGYFRALTLGGVQYYINIDEGNKLITFSWVSGGTVRTFTTGYYSTLTGIMFTEPFNTGTIIIPGINFTSWNPSTSTMNVTVNNISGTISNAGQPLQLDLTAARRWWQYSYDREDYWFSVYGFTVDGVRDAYKVRSLANIYYLGYWAWYNTNNGVQYDLLGFIKINEARTALTLPYGAAYRRPSFTADGRIIFPFYGTLGTVPPDDNATYTNTSAKLADPDGYYLVQTGALTYDMVSKDGKSWITWQW